MPRASIIIQAYNAADYIDETLESILTQSYTDFEIIIIDDGSTDNTADRIKGFSDDRIRYYYQPNSGSPSGSRNRALTLARGDVIFLFEPDSVMLPDKLKASMDALDSAPDAGMVFTGFCCIDEDDNIVNPNFLGDYHTLNNLPKNLVISDAWLIRSSAAAAGLAYSNYIGSSGVAIKRSVLDKVGYFDTEVRYADDKLMWSAIANEFDLVYIPTVYHKHRLRNGRPSMRDIVEKSESVIIVLRKMKRFPLPEHCYKALDRQISEKYCQQGYAYFNRYRFDRARVSFVRSMRTKFNKKSLYYYLLALIPVDLIRTLKAIKHSCRT